MAIKIRENKIMADWTGSFKMPHVTTEEFEKKKAAYVAKYGYRYSIPGFDDIFHLNLEKPFSEDEEKLWSTGRKDEIPPVRRAELQYIKQQRKERYLDMLGSPIPKIFRSRASLLTAIDDAQDATTTLAVVGMVVARGLPPALRAMVLAGTGWVMIASQLLNMATAILAPEQMALSRKRIQDRVTTDNPFTKKARVKVAKKLRAGKIGVGALIEISQTTDNIFGVGLSLGAVMALPLNIIFGAAKRFGSYPVEVHYPVPDIQHWAKRAKKLHPALLAMYGIPVGTDDDEMTMHLMAANALSQLELTDIEAWNPLDNVKDLQYVGLAAPTPTKSYLLEILEETDPDWRNSVVWPSTGFYWSNPHQLSESSHEMIADNFRSYSERQKNSELGWIGAQNASHAGLNIIEALEGPGAIQTDYTAWTKTIHALLDAGYIPPADLTEEQRNCFIAWLNAHETMNTTPSTPEALDYVKYNCGWEFVRE